MLNIINTQIPNNDNIIAARKISSSTNRRAVILDAPQYVPEYSITKRMEEQDLFRNTAIQASIIKTENKNTRKRVLKGLLLTASTIIGIILCKKS